MPRTTEHRAWARQHMAGVENTTIPSFTADLSELDEEAIRLDVRQAKAHGFFSTLVATEAGVSLAEAKRMIEVVVDEAGDDLLVSTPLLLDSFAANEEMLRHCERTGVHTVLMGHPANWYPESPEQVYDVFREIIGSTTLSVVLYPNPLLASARFGATWFPLDILTRLVDECPNIVGMKIGEMGMFADCWHRFGDRILMSSPIERDQPTLVGGFKTQWMGAGCYEVFQTPDKPYLVDYHRLLREGRYDEALDIYWKITPARLTFERQHMVAVMTGTYNWTQQKFYQYCTGGNGGCTRQPAMKVAEPDKRATRMAFRAIGITPDDNDAEFSVGRTAYARQAVTAVGA